MKEKKERWKGRDGNRSGGGGEGEREGRKGEEREWGWREGVEKGERL